MKKVCLALLMLFSNTSFANQAINGLVNTAVVGGAIVGVNEAFYQNWISSEMKTWKSDSTGTTTRLYNSCGMNVELRILSSRRSNSIFIAVQNPTKDSVVLKLNHMQVKYSTGRTRTYSSYFQISDKKIESGWWTGGYFPLERKKDIKGADSIEVFIPLIIQDKECVAKGTLYRNESAPDNYEDYTRILSLDLSVRFGMISNLSNGSENLYGKSASSFAFDIGFYPWNYHGFHFGIQRTDVDKSISEQVRIDRGLTKTPDLYDSTLFLGYQGYNDLNEKWTLFWNAGYFSITLEESGTDDDDFSSESTSSYYLGTELDYVLARKESGPFQGDYFIGFGINYRKIPKVDVTSIKTNGDSLMTFVSLRAAF